MPREKKFTFLPVRNEDLRRKPVNDEPVPYVRIQRPGLLVFPRTTLEYFNIGEGQLVYMRFYIDVPKRALAFKFVDKAQAEEFKEFKPLSIKWYASSGLQGTVSIKSILNQFGEWAMPCKCDLDEYNDTDEYIQLGKMNYFTIPKPTDPNSSGRSDSDLPCPYCDKHCDGKRSLAQHKRQNHPGK